MKILNILEPDCIRQNKERENKKEINNNLFHQTTVQMVIKEKRNDDELKRIKNVVDKMVILFIKSSHHIPVRIGQCIDQNKKGQYLKRQRPRTAIYYNNRNAGDPHKKSGIIFCEEMK